tara:strand:- start:4682 stop:5344 length:663 start_codon:yes stop_codon:yes gene_type:complete
MNRNKIIELAKKIKALAEKGKGGERNAAKEKLERICKKYNISPDEISTSDESKDYYIVINDQNERELLINICCMIMDVPGLKWKEKNNCICIRIKLSEYENIISAFEYYRDMYNDYKRYLIQGIIARNVIGYIPKHQTYTQENIQQDISPVPTEDVKKEETEQKPQGNDDESSNENENSEDKSEDVRKESPIDPIKLMKIAVALDKKPWVKNDPNKKLIE